MAASTSFEISCRCDFNCSIAFVIETMSWKARMVATKWFYVDELALFITNVFGNHVVPIKRDPLHELVKIPRFCWCPPEWLAAAPPRKCSASRTGTDDSPQLSKREVQLVLAGVTTEPSQNVRRQDRAGLHSPGQHPSPQCLSIAPGFVKTANFFRGKLSDLFLSCRGCIG